MKVPVFYLGTHMPHWLWDTRFTLPRLCVSYRQLARRPTRRLRRAVCRWALDSGGFTFLKDYGRWPITPAEYVAAARRYAAEIGGLDWVAPQDWMCEPAVIAGGRIGRLFFVGTGLDVVEHQRRTVANYLQLRALAPDLPFIPVLQGWTLDDYLTCADMYAAAGVDLAAAPLVGLGSVCRRQSTAEIGHIVTTLAREGLRLHGFGVKTLGLERYGHALASADSLAWSTAARYEPPLPGCAHRNCANCPIYATQWQTTLLDRLTTHHHQGDLFDLITEPTHKEGRNAA